MTERPVGGGRVSLTDDDLDALTEDAENRRDDSVLILIAELKTSRQREQQLEGERDKARAQGVARRDRNAQLMRERDRARSRAEDFEGRYETAHASRMHADACYLRVEAERDRLRDGIAAHRNDVRVLSDFNRALQKRHDERLWRLLDDTEDDQ